MEPGEEDEAASRGIRVSTAGPRGGEGAASRTEAPSEEAEAGDVGQEISDKSSPPTGEASNSIRKRKMTSTLAVEEAEEEGEEEDHAATEVEGDLLEATIITCSSNSNHNNNSSSSSSYRTASAAPLLELPNSRHSSSSSLPTSARGHRLR